MTWLEICGKNNDCSGCCPYSENGFGEYGQCRKSLMADAYDLLKEQDKIIQNILLEKANELNDKVTTLQIEEQNREIRRLSEQK